MTERCNITINVNAAICIMFAALLKQNKEGIKQSLIDQIGITDKGLIEVENIIDELFIKSSEQIPFKP